ncbi:sulfatase-like hydrolase/transferase [Rhodospirillaceae bacterium KN72]|uniref:Sulfatase-like hydrolase/transferase n=1 Tax=Pacificispira spongiicola TaxID=2729598 RepID=A0A7Y0HEK3_9PROT|nr:sulfatase-like hydrolase/transferase [Pacificispira spongiicola]NMM43658.1 sulfatase-like hydrolase/transferase [Pacificispira spongiicola]
MTAKARNLLVIVADELRRDVLGCMNNALVRTPNLDALAARGTVFERAYTPSPICVSARAALATGRYVHHTGHWDSAAPYYGDPAGWMHAVRDQGVSVRSFGKLHFRSSADDNGFVEEFLPMHVVDGRGWTVGLLRKDPPVFGGAAELAADVGEGESDYTRFDTAITEKASDWIAIRSKNTAPWAAFVSFVAPHYPLRAPKPFLDLYDPAHIPMPIGRDAVDAPTHPELKHIAGFFDYDRYFTPERAAAARAAYYALVSFMDDCVGRVLIALEASGQAEDTCVVFTSDHGEMLGDHGFWAKSVMYEGAVGVPMIAAGPGFAAGHRVATPVSLVDIAATAADQFGAQAFSEHLPGQSLRHLASMPDDPGRTVFSEYHDGGSSTASYMVRWDRWKYVHYVGAPPQLFDRASDSQECLDLGESMVPDHVAARAEGLMRLKAICDPDQVNADAFEDQSRRIAEFGGPEACRSVAFNHTPAPIG